MANVGYWLNTKNGQTIIIADHGQDVLTNPEAFGMDEKSVAKYKNYNPGDTSSTSSRGKLLIDVMKRGFARIRQSSNAYHVQCYGTMLSTAKALIKGLKGKIGPYSTIILMDLSSDQRVTAEGFSDLAKLIKSGELSDGVVSTNSSGEKAETGDTGQTKISRYSPDVQQRNILRSRIGNQTGIPDRDANESWKPFKITIPTV